MQPQHNINWNNVPISIIVEIQSHLSDQDRARSARVNRNWDEAFNVYGRTHSVHTKKRSYNRRKIEQQKEGQRKLKQEDEKRFLEANEYPPAEAYEEEITLKLKYRQQSRTHLIWSLHNCIDGQIEKLSVILKGIYGVGLITSWI